MVGGDDSTVVGITQRLSVSGERVGERVQGGSVSERQGTFYSCTCHSTLQFVIEPPAYTGKPFVLECSAYHLIIESI